MPTFDIYFRHAIMVRLSSSATQEILRLKSKQPSPVAYLRISLVATGCLELSYALSFDSTATAEDILFSNNEIQIIIDPQVSTHLKDLVIDYSEDLMGGGFRFYNPQAGQVCGCGNSFSTGNTKPNSL